MDYLEVVGDGVDGSFDGGDGVVDELSEVRCVVYLDLLQ